MELAFKDGLTDIFNHRRINEILTYETKRAKRRADVFSIMILDVDNLKEINDTYGHIVGDKALKHIASLVKGSLRDGDSVGRYGGDEFLVILPNTPRNGALTMAERIHEKLRTKLFALTGKDFVSTFLSIGVATYPFDSINEKGLIEAADKEMYSAKRCSKK
ncbi:GGDEF domain-containing protein [Thermodesulfovibrionales bacterium]|nr:GGDEF domain-containing protein [Thermodesulfovibrionales bacterium]